MNRPTRCAFLVAVTLLAAAAPAVAQFSQQGPKLVGANAVGPATVNQGQSVALSANGDTAVVGGYGDNNNAGAVWVWTRGGGDWTQQGPKLFGSSATYADRQGWSVSVSADGNTALVGGYGDSDLSNNTVRGAAWVWTRSGGVWTQQGPKLVGSGSVGDTWQGHSVSLSADGNTALVGGSGDNGGNSGVGAAWVWTRSGGVWTQQGPKLVGSGAIGGSRQGWSVALSGDGNTALVGGFRDNNQAGAAWVWTRSAGVWTQQGPKLVGAGALFSGNQGWSVSLSADGNTALVGGNVDNAVTGAAWVWTRSGGVWTQQGPKLVGTGATGAAGQGSAVSLSADGNTAIVAGYQDNSLLGATWVWARNGSTWTQQGTKLVGSGAVGPARQGYSSSLSLSADARTFLVGGPFDNSQAGAAWVFAVPPPPTIGSLPDVFTRVNVPIAVPVTVGSAGAGGSAGLTLTGTSSNPTLVPNANLAFSGSGTSRTLTITPAANQKGTTTITVTTSDNTGTASASFVLRVGPPPPGDFDGDGRAEIAVFRPSTGVWYVRGVSITTWGGGADVPVAGDYDGDGKTDVAVYRPSTGAWFVLRSSTATGSVTTWGGGADIPVPGDYDGDGKTDIAVFRPSTGVWFTLLSSTSSGSVTTWGGGADIPVPDDYDGDGKTDVAVFRPSTSTWYILQSSTATGSVAMWGGGADIPVAADYDGDGKADVAVFRPSTGAWFILRSSTASGSVTTWGGGADVPVPADFDNDGKTDIAVFRPSTGDWFILNSSTGSGAVVTWGGGGDIPVLKRP